MSNIDRRWPPKGTDDLYHYARANGSNVFYTTASYNNAGVGAPVASLVSTFHRSVVHVKSGNYIITYDRSVPRSGTIEDRSRWHTINPMTAVGSTFKSDSGNGRIFRRPIHLSPGATYLNRQDTDLGGATSWREEIGLPVSGGSSFEMEVFQITNTLASTMQPMSKSPATGIGLSLDNTFFGVTIEEAVFKHFLFSTEITGITPATMIYYVQKNGNDDIHRVFDLKPGQEYWITETTVGLPSGYARYVFTETFNTGFTANTGGIVEFTPAALGTVGIIYYNVGITDITTANSDSVVATQAKFNMGVTDAAATNSADDLNAGKNAVYYSEQINDNVGTGTDALRVDSAIFINDTGGTSVDVVDAVRTGFLPPPVYTQKRIDGPVVSLVPDGDFGSSFFVAIPNDGVMWNKVNSADDADFIRPNPTPVIQTAFAAFTLTGGQSVKTIRSIQFAARIRSAQFTNIVGPYLRMMLYKGGFTTLIKYYDIPLQETDGMWLRSPIIAVNITASDIEDLILSCRPRAISYEGSYNVDFSSLFVDASGDPIQKGI